MKKKLRIGGVEVVRDVFVLGCLRGLGLWDVGSVKKENVVEENVGEWWIRKGRVKLEEGRKGCWMRNIGLVGVGVGILEK